jgi:hypothetical protein
VAVVDTYWVARLCAQQEGRVDLARQYVLGTLSHPPAAGPTAWQSHFRLHLGALEPQEPHMGSLWEGILGKLPDSRWGHGRPSPMDP